MSLLKKVFLLAIFIIGGNGYTQCVKPITSNHNVNQWDDLINFKLDGRINNNIKFVQTIDGLGEQELNLDYYSIIIDKPENIDEFWEDFRINLTELIFEDGKIETLYGSIESYDPNNNVKWESDKPKGALMSFVMANFGFIHKERGSVVVSCHTDTQWVFTTVTTDKDGFHPVSGNRAFGYYDNLDGSITIYTKGADRLTITDKWKEIVQPRIGWRSITLLGGDHIWKTFLKGIEKKYRKLKPRNKIDGIIKTIPYGKPHEPDYLELFWKDINEFLFPIDSKENLTDFKNGIKDYPANKEMYKKNFQNKVLIAKINSSKESIPLKGQKTTNEKNTFSIDYYKGMLWAFEYEKSLNQQLAFYSDFDEFPKTILQNNSIDNLANSLFARNLSKTIIFENHNNISFDDIKFTSIAPAYYENELKKILPNYNLIIKNITNNAEAEIFRLLETEIEKYKDEILQSELNSLAQENDISPEMIDGILKLNDLINKKITWEEFEGLMRDYIFQYVYQAALLSGNCLCTPPKCSVFEAVCTSYYYYNKINDWDGSLADVLSLLNEYYPELEQFAETYEYYEALEAYKNNIEEAIKLYENVEKIKIVVKSFETISSSLDNLKSINIENSIKNDYTERFDNYYSVLNKLPLNSSEIVKYRNLDSKKSLLISDIQKIKKLINEIITSLLVIDNEFSDLFDMDNFLTNYIHSLEKLSKIATEKLVPVINNYNDVFSENDKAVFKMLNTINKVNALSNTFLDDILNGINIQSLQDATSNVYILTNSLNLQDSIINLTNFNNRKLLTHKDKSFIYNSNYSNLLTKIDSLYDFQSKRDIRQRFNESKSAFFFFRQFPPYFYDKLSEKLNSYNEYSDFRKITTNYRGWVMGDVHPQNFGTIMPMDNSGSLNIVMNDPDDGGEGSLFQDYIRFMVGSELLDLGVLSKNYDRIVEAYLDGLNLKNRPLSISSEELISNKDFYRNRRIKQSKLSGATFRKDKYLVPIQLTRKLNSSDSILAIKKIRKFFHKEAQFEDGYKYKRLKGGSGGNGRWEVLVSLKLDDINGHSLERNFYWIEFKMLGLIPGNYPSSQIDYKSFKSKKDLINNAKNRYRANIIVGQGLNALPLYKFVDTDDGPAMMRYRSEGNQFYPVDILRYYDKEALVDVIVDQSYILGKIQRKGYDIWNDENQIKTNILNYVELISKINKAKLKKLVEEMRFELETDFLTIQKTDNDLLKDIYSAYEFKGQEVKKFQKLVEDQYFDYLNFNEGSKLNQIEIQKFKNDTSSISKSKELIISKFIRENESTIKSEIKIDNPKKLGIYQINFRPTDLTYNEKQKGWSKKSFEYILLANVSNDTLVFEKLEFRNGVKHKFSENLSIPKGNLLLIAKNVEAVKARYNFDHLESPIIYESDFHSSALGAKEYIELVNYTKDKYDRIVEEKLISLSYNFEDSLDDSGFVVNMGISNEIGELLKFPKWSFFKPETNYGMLGDLKPIALNFRSSSGDMNDFFILKNHSEKQLNTQGLKIIGKQINYNFNSILSPNEIVILCQDTVALRTKYNVAKSTKVYEYNGRLSNKKEEIKLKLFNSQDTTTVWKIKYHKDWFSKNNGKTKMIVPNNVCEKFELLQEKTGWKETILENSLDKIQENCYKPIYVNLCGDRKIDEIWEQPIQNDSIGVFKCFKVNGNIMPVLIDSFPKN